MVIDSNLNLLVMESGVCSKLEMRVAHLGESHPRMLSHKWIHHLFQYQLDHHPGKQVVEGQKIERSGKHPNFESHLNHKVAHDPVEQRVVLGVEQHGTTFVQNL